MKLNVFISLKLIIFLICIPELTVIKFICFAGMNIAYDTGITGIKNCFIFLLINIFSLVFNLDFFRFRI